MTCLPYYRPMTDETSMFSINSYCQEEMKDAMSLNAHEISGYLFK